ncbi:A1 cistron-splicing factor [Aspergillus coremiiformis]|uniref:A1 cistron-splicing factor n=1 Tax=Aspergillus coremiiformis TaxID=138285 RepID=A0A5N6Z544_9EURO|nr:A1 cistron-splicing factor [Aspergillus coremiiformis]
MASVTPSPTILVPYLPPKTLVGIDLIAFTSTPNFHGIRDIPNGWHFLYTGATESLSLRSGGWFYVGDISAPGGTNDGAIIPAPRGNLTSEVVVWKWNTDTETLVPLRASDDVDKQEAMRHKANLAAIWQRGGLLRYRSRAPSSGGRSQSREVDDEENEEEGRRDWEGLTDRLSPGLLRHIVGDPDIDVDARPRWMVTSASTAQRDSENIPGIPEPGQDSGRLVDVIGEQESEFSFLPVDLKKTWREGAIGRERTEAAQDRSWALGDLIQQASVADGERGGIDEQLGETHILGELQFTFLMVLTLMNYSCLQQWKRLLNLILTCQRAIKEREQFMSNVLRLLLLQLQRSDDIEGGFFDLDGEEGGEFLRKLLMKFRTSLYEVIEDAGALVTEDFKKLESWVKDEYDWELNRGAFVRRGILQLEDGEQVEMDMGDDGNDEMGEYAPVVVDLGEGNTMQDV